MGLRRLEPLLILALFGLPLLVGLGRMDLENDEAIYSFAVDRILETGDWLIPRSSPNDDQAYLEKPPLKFWIVAASIKLGLLPHDEFGLRFWDVAFSATSFLYVFLLGRRLAGSLGGWTAALLLFVQPSLIYEHGIRGANLESPVLLTYCAGVYHFLAWVDAGPDGGRRHAYLTTLAFGLGFMSKSLAAAFLPAILVTVSGILPAVRQKVWAARRLWIRASVLAAVLVVPWFAYAAVTHARDLWTVQAVDIYTRLATERTAYIEPWHFYMTSTYQSLRSSHAVWLTGLGGVLLGARAVRHRHVDAALVCVWLLLPLIALSCMSLKFYYYFYPFLPPVALMAGCAAACVVGWGTRGLHRLGDAAEAWLRGRSNRLATVDWGRMPRWWRDSIGRPGIRVWVVSAVVTLVSWILLVKVAGPLGLDLGPWPLPTHPLVVRLLVAALFILMFADRWRPLPLVLGLVVGLAVPTRAYAAVHERLPTSAYREILEALPRERHPIRDLRDCLLGLYWPGERDGGSQEPAMLADAVDRPVLHVQNYYLRQIRPWQVLRESPPYPRVYGRVFGLGPERPVLLSNSWYARFLEQVRESNEAFLAAVAQANGVSLDEVRRTVGRPVPPAVPARGYVLLLPGPYAACVAAAS